MAEKRQIVINGGQFEELQSEDYDIQSPALKNLLINGAMRFARRSASDAGITSSGYFVHDRWRFGVLNAGTWTMSQENDGPTDEPFKKSLKVKVTTANPTLDATDHVGIYQRLHGADAYQLLYGSSDAKSVTLTFWVKSSVTGTYTVNLFGTSYDGYVGKSYTIDSADTWEKKTLTFDGETTTGITYGISYEFGLLFRLADGSSYTSGTFTEGDWTTVTAETVHGSQVDLSATVDNDFYLTGVQLEIGEASTPFEWLPFQLEEQLCMRYFEELAISQDYIAGGDYGTMYRSYAWKVRKRTTPTVTANGTFQYYSGGSGTAFTPTFVAAVDFVTVKGLSLTNARGLLSGLIRGDAEL